LGWVSDHLVLGHFRFRVVSGRVGSGIRSFNIGLFRVMNHIRTEQVGRVSRIESNSAISRCNDCGGDEETLTSRALAGAWCHFRREEERGSLQEFFFRIGQYFEIFISQYIFASVDIKKNSHRCDSC
jgi:hypothetical protein